MNEQHNANLLIEDRIAQPEFAGVNPNRIADGANWAQNAFGAKRANLVLHCGANQVSRDDVASVYTPEPTRSWMPISHISLIEQVELVLRHNNLKIVGQAHALSHAGMRYFGLMEIRNGQNSEEYSWVLGARNSHDQTYPAALVAGANVFVCDNLSFSGEVKLSRKHTTFIWRDLPQLTERAIGRLMQKWHQQDERIAAYKGHDLLEMSAHDLIIRSVDVGAMPPSKIPDVLKEWRNPRHEEFEPRTSWSLFNCFTEVLKGSLTALPKRTEALHGLFDSYCGLGQQLLN